MITDINDLDLNKKYSYLDYLSWKLKERVELIKGKIFQMTPAPSLLHQKVSGNLHGEIILWLKGKPCHLFPASPAGGHAPFDVRLLKGSKDDKDIYTVIQPDLCIVCDENKLDKRGCVGAPDLVIEIISPSTADKDLHEKYEIYEEAGVREYWIVEPSDMIVNVFILNERGVYESEKPKSRSDKLISKAIPGLEIDLQEVFPMHFEEAQEKYGKEIRLDP